MRCRKCDSTVNEDWSFCPSCGAKVPPKSSGIIDFFNVGLEEVFDKFMSRQMDEMLRNFSEPPADFDRQNFRGRGFRGMTVRITQSGNNPPTINVDHFNPQDPHQPAIHAGESESPPVPRIEAMEQKVRTHSKRESAKGRRNDIIPKTTVEPKVDIVRLPGKIVIETELPGIKSEKDIQILELGESLEIRAFAGERIYLKIVQIPPEIHIKERTFSGEKLKIELGKRTS